MKKYIYYFITFLTIAQGISFAFPSPDKIKPEIAYEKAVENLLDTFEKSLKEEDIDLLDSIISKNISDKEGLITPFENNLNWLDFISVKLNKKKITFSKGSIKASARLTKTAEDVANVLNETQTHDFSFVIDKRTDKNGIIEFGIGLFKEGKNTVVIRNDAISKDDKDFEIRVFSSDKNGLSNISSAEVNFQGSKEWIELKNQTESENIFFFINSTITLKGLKGSLNVSSNLGPHSINVKIKTTDGRTTHIKHPFKVSEGNIESMDTSSSKISFRATAKDKNNVMWFGGSNGGRIFNSTDGKTINEVFNLGECLAAKNLPEDTWIEDMAIDSSNRVHLIFLGIERYEDYPFKTKRVVSGDAAFDANIEDIRCEDMSKLIDYDLSNEEGWNGEDGYPFKDKYGNRTAITRALSGGNGSVWLLGSDGGVANFLDSRKKRYKPIFRRLNSDISSNIVPTAVIDKKRDIWFGTIAGINKYDLDGKDFSVFPYIPNSTFDSSKVDTLEKYFEALVSNIITNRNISGIGKELSGLNLIKEDFIWSSATDNIGKLWFGTLGGGIRVFENGEEKKEMHLTKGDGLISNIILSIAVDENNNIWTGTEQGVSRIKVQNKKCKIKNFTALDGLGDSIIWDITPDNNGNVWFATQNGIFKYKK